MNAQPDDFSKAIRQKTLEVAATFGDPEHKPAWRGQSHKYAAIFSLLAMSAALAMAEPGLPWFAGYVGLGCITATLGISGAYHTINWHPEVRVWFRRVDHTMIFICIAGIYTTYALLVLKSETSQNLVPLFWLAATIGGFLKLVWVHAPKGINVILYVSMSWSGMTIYEELGVAIGQNAIHAVLGSGLLISVGAVLYGLGWPGRHAKRFGYHEWFHITVIIHLAVQFWVICHHALKVF